MREDITKKNTTFLFILKGLNLVFTLAHFKEREESA